MSRYALEWAKWKRVEDPAAKLVLLIVADHAEGPKSTCTLREGDFEDEADIDRKELHAIIDRLQSAGALTSTILRRPTVDPSDVHAAGVRRNLERRWGEPIRFGLNIADDWRSGARAAKPKLDGRFSPGRPTAVYRLYDATGDLLYVGIAVFPDNRFEQHKAKAFWWWRVVTREITWFETRTAALAEEYRAIKQDKPIFNVQHASDEGGIDRSKRQPYSTHPASPDALGAAVSKLHTDIRAGRYDIHPLPPDEILAKAYGIPEASVWHLHFRLAGEGATTCLPDKVDGRRVYYRPWGEW